MTALLSVPPAVVPLDAFVYGSDVGGQVAPVGIGDVGATQFAPEGLLAQVDVHVLLQVGLLQEALARLANGALERLVFTPRVGTLDVPFHLALRHHQPALVTAHLLVAPATEHPYSFTNSQVFNILKTSSSINVLMLSHSQPYQSHAVGKQINAEHFQCIH